MIKLTKPYKIASHKVKRYTLHYGIPAERVVVVPMKLLGAEVLCDIRWEDENGELQFLDNKMFLIDNLVPLNPLLELELQQLWEHYYGNMTSSE
jgi:hypothetical protein